MSRTPGNAAALAAQRQARYAARKRVNQVALTLSLAAMAFGLFWLIWILWETLRLGLGGLSLMLFSQMTPPPNEAGATADADATSDSDSTADADATADATSNSDSTADADATSDSNSTADGFCGCIPD